jgi:hypothetical protein
MGARILIVLALSLAACERTSQKYCGIHPEDYAHCPIPDGVVLVGCTGNSDCKAPTLPVCDTSIGICVGCLADTDCKAPKPRCDLQNHVCVECTSDGDCGLGSMCLFGGVCSTSDNVAFVDTTGKDNPDCTQALPCLTAKAGLMTGKPYVQLNGMFSEKGGITIPNNVDVTIVGTPGSSYQRSDNGDTITIGMGGNVGIAKLDISCTAGNGIKTMSGTFSFSQLTVHGCVLGIATAGSVTMTRSKIYDNTSTGLTLAGATHFEITNSMFVHNGAVGADVRAGGVILGMGTTGDSFEFNTVADNSAKLNMTMNAGGIACPMGFPLADDIFAGNSIYMGPTPMPSNLGNGCVLSGSLQQATDLGLNFVNSLTSPYDYHLMTGSLAVDGAPADNNIKEDYDGDPRPMGGGYDYGADEL